MTRWTSDELSKIGAAEELQIASLRRDGTLSKPVTVWVIRHGDSLYVRSWHGRTAAWFRGVQDRHEGHISAGGVDKDVTFVDANPDLDDQIDSGHRTKYHQYAATFAEPMVSPAARFKTLQLETRSAGCSFTRRNQCRSSGTAARRPRWGRASGSPARSTSTRSRRRPAPRT